jgi:hypothetical protein
MSKQTQQRYSDIGTVEQLVAGQGLTYTYNNGLVTFHAQEGDRTFNWLDEQGIEKTIQWLQGREQEGRTVHHN